MKYEQVDKGDTQAVVVCLSFRRWLRVSDGGCEFRAVPTTPIFILHVHSLWLSARIVVRGISNVIIKMNANEDCCFLLYFIMGTYFIPDLKGEKTQKSVL